MSDARGAGQGNDGGRDPAPALMDPRKSDLASRRSDTRSDAGKGPSDKIAGGMVEVAVPHRRMCDQCDPEVGERWEEQFNISPYKGPLLLHGSDRVYGMSSSDVIERDIGQPQSPDLPCLAELGHSVDGLLDWCVLAAVMQVVKIEVIDVEAPE